MISTYEIEKKLHDLMVKNNKGEADLQEFISAFIEATSTAIEYKKQRDALMESIDELVEEDIAQELYDETELKMSEYDFRYMSEEDVSKLEEYGYTKPIVPVDYEDAMEYFDEGYPVFLLNRDNTEKPVTLGINIEHHIKDGGMVGVQQFAVEDMETKRLENIIKNNME